MSSPGWRAAAVRAALLLLWVPIVLLVPLLVLGLHRHLPSALENLLFVWPLAAFPLDTYHGAPPHAGARVWPGWWVIYWILVLIAFAFRTRRIRLSWAFALAGLTALGGTLLLQGLISASGLHFELGVP